MLNDIASDILASTVTLHSRTHDGNPAESFEKNLQWQFDFNVTDIVISLSAALFTLYEIGCSQGGYSVVSQG